MTIMWLITMSMPSQMHAAPPTRAANSAQTEGRVAVGSRPLMRILDIAPKSGAPPFSLLRTALSFQGLPGLIDIPVAATIPSGHVDLQYHTKRDVNRFPGVDSEKTFNFAIGFLPWLTIGGRGTVVTEDGRDIERDIAANAQLLLIGDRRWWPAVAVGFNDVAGGRNLFGSRYFVLSKQLFGRLRATVGYGFGPDVLKGPFGGGELALNRYITLMGEHDTDGYNAGLRLFPLPEAFEAYGVPRPSVDLIWQDGDDFAWGISLRAGLGEAKYRAQRTALARKRFQRTSYPHGEGTDLPGICEALQIALLEYGFENVRVTLLPRDRESIMAVVEYENRRYNRNELDALGIVLGATAIRMPPEVTHVQAIVKRINLPVFQFTAPIEDFLAYVNREISQSALAQTLRMTNQVTPSTGRPLAQTPIRQRSWLKLDVFLRPSIATRILTELGEAELRFGVLPDASMQLTPGTVFNVRANVPVTQTSHFPGSLPDPVVDRILIHQALRLPLGKWSRHAAGFTQFSIGRFTREEVGIANETALTLWDGWLFFRSVVARVGDAFDDLDQWVAWANGRVRYPPWDLTLSLAGGRFLDDDTGIAASLGRFFGNTNISFFIRHTDRGSLGGIRLSVPLTVARALPPWRIRPRLPDVFSYAQTTTIFTDRNVVRSDIGRSVPTGHSLERMYWNRDRLYPAYIRRHLDVLAHAMRKWVDAALIDVPRR